MALSTLETIQYTAEDFIESAGTILFNVPGRRICLVHRNTTGEWLIAKGRRNIGESREAAALRETREETGFECHLLPVTMTTRAPLLHLRGMLISLELIITVLGGGRLKIIWWYIGAIDEEAKQGEAESQFRAQLFTFDEALEALTFATDREVVRKAIEIFSATADTKK